MAASNDRGSGASRADTVAAARRQMAESIAAYRRGVAQRWGAASASGQSAPRARVRGLLEASRTRAHELLDAGAAVDVPGQPAYPGTGLSLEDCHTLELLLSHVRHSVVRVCFYNLKLFCPSLIDEYDDDVRRQVTANLAQLPRVREELDAFFHQDLPAGHVSSLFGDEQAACISALAKLDRLAGDATGRLEQEPVRRAFAERAPGLIDAVMAPLAKMQAALDGRKAALSDLLEQALELSAAALQRAGIKVRTHLEQTPRVFGDETALLNALCEVFANAAKYSQAENATVTLRQCHEDGHWAEVSVRDDGKGMTAVELAACRNRGFSRGGTGEGLPMVAGVVEGDHLGRLCVEAAPGEGVCVVMRLPVKLEAKTLTAQGD